MKSFTKALFALFTITFFFISCQNQNKDEKHVDDGVIAPTEALPAAPVTIFVYVGVSEDNSLIMSDGGYTKIKQGATINWEILPFSVNVDSIVGINPKPNNVDIWQPGKGPKKGTIPPGIRDHWAGKTRPNLIPNGGNPFVYEYNIKWKDSSGIEHTFDPKIEIDQ